MKIKADHYSDTDTPIAVPCFAVAYNHRTSKGNVHNVTALFYDNEKAKAFASLIGEDVFITLAIFH